MIRSHILATGAHLPDTIVTNEDLARRVDTSDEWIRERSGIRQRHQVAPDQPTSALAIAASRQALARAGLTGADLDLIVLATTTPDRTFPATAVRVQAALGMERGAAFDVQAVCSGFVYALAVADSLLKAGGLRRALVIGAESFTRLLDWEDRTTCVLFGDGAGAVVLEARDDGAGTKADRGILSTHLHSDGQYEDLLYTDGGAGSTQTVGRVRMNGKEVFRHAVTRLAEVVDEALRANGATAAELDWLVPHQANQRILDATAKKLGMPAEKVVSTIAHHGNTSAASIPLALDSAVSDGRIKRGDLLLLEAMGGGLTWGAALVRF